MLEKGLSRNEIFVELAKSEHGDYKKYVPVGFAAARLDADFLAHLLVWNKEKGQVRDSKVALPVIALMNPKLDEEHVDNALACLTLLAPREMLKAMRFTLEVRPPGRMSIIRRVLTGRLMDLEANWPKWERMMLQHWDTLRQLVALLHYQPVDIRTNACLFRAKGKTKLAYPPSGLFEITAQLKDMQPTEMAGTILNKKIPFQMAVGSLGSKSKHPDVVMAFDLRKKKIDAVSIPNLVQSMRTNRYSLVDEIMETRLLKLKDGYKQKRKEVKRANV